MDASRNASSQAAPLARGASTARARAGSRAARHPAGTRLAVAALLALLLASPAARALGDPVVRPGKWNPKKAPPGWVVVETGHYQVQSQCGKDKAVALAAHLEAMLDMYRAFLPTHRKLDGFVLKLFKDRPAFVDYGGNDGAVAYYNQGAGELVGYDTGVVLGTRDIPAQLALAPGAGKDLTPEELTRLAALFEEITDAYTMDTARVLSHEGWHQYFHFYTTSIVSMPAWIDEGIGDYFFMASRDEQHGDANGYRLGDINQGRMRTLAREFGSRLEPEDFTGEKRWLTVYTWHVKHPEEPAGDASAGTSAGETPEGAPGNSPGPNSSAEPPGAVPARCVPGS